jgi:hypothetical protein
LGRAKRRWLSHHVDDVVARLRPASARLEVDQSLISRLERLTSTPVSAIEHTSDAALLTAHFLHITQRLAHPAANDVPPQAAGAIAEALILAVGNYALAAGQLKHAQQRLQRPVGIHRIREPDPAFEPAGPQAVR